MSNLGPNFYPKLVQISSELGMNPEDLLSVMVSESGIDPSAHESKSNGGGLVGFMPSTLKTLKFPGSPEDFRKLTGEEQLDWVKKLVQGYMGMNNGPFTSAAQYYVANFFPVALKLPGIKQGNPNTIFIEKNPETVKDPKSNKIYSKKYYDIGVKLSPRIETMAYEANPLFHGSAPNAITYGDMLKQIQKNKSTDLYRQAVISMRESNPNYKPTNNTMIARKNTINDKLNNYLQMVLADNNYKKLYKLLPSNNILIQINGSDLDTQVEFSRILCTALDEELLADAYPFIDNNKLEIECKINGPDQDCFNTVSELSNSLAEVFNDINKFDIKTFCIMNKTSSYKELTSTAMDVCHRRFLLKLI